MIVIAGHWEIGYKAPVMEAYEWAFPLRDFGVTEWAMCPVSGVRNPDKQVNLKEFPNYKEMLDYYSDLQRVYLEPRNNKYNPETVWLHDFEHPDDCIYIFGSAHKNPTIGTLRDEDVVVSIKTKLDNGVLWSNQCVTVLLYDRMIRYGSNNT